MLDGWASKLALGYLAAGPAVNDAARLTAIARQRRAEVALQNANDDRQHLCEQFNQLAAYVNALATENAALRQDRANLLQENTSLRQQGTNLQQYAFDLEAWGERLRGQLVEARRIAEEEAVRSKIREILFQTRCA
jgi:regulator of replication initiation timing